VLIVLGYIFLGIIVIGIINTIFNFGGGWGERNLEEDYEVLFFSCQKIFDDRPNHPQVEMKSWGDRKEQVWDGLFALSMDCPDGEDYVVQITEETQDCWYFIDGDIYKAYLGENKTAMNYTKIMETIDYQLWSHYITEGEPDAVDIMNYNDMVENGFSSHTLWSIIEYKIDTATCN